ncbi:MAG: helix-hairpin-helix domain-containing protein [Alkaliphilus sp.]
MVKDNKHTLRGLYFEKTEHKLPSHTSIYRFLAYIQDEAHRFALNYHKSLRNKSMLASTLREIRYIGEKKTVILMKYFLDIKRIDSASVEDLYKVKGISRQDANRIYGFFQHRALKK